MAAVGVPVGFFRAHAALKRLTIAEKLVRMNSFRVATPVILGPVATLAAAGAAFAATDCAAEEALGRGGALPGVLGGLAVGAVFGLKHASLSRGLGVGAACAGFMLAADFFESVVHPAFDDVKRHGPKEARAPAA